MMSTGMRKMESKAIVGTITMITTMVAIGMITYDSPAIMFSDAYLVIPQQYHHHVAPASTTLLFAKATKNKKKTNNKSSSSSSGSSSRGGGFGVVKETKVSTTTSSSFNPITNDNSNNYDVFPPLDDAVKSTLIPSDDVDKIYDANITPDIYGRLDQIYGFPQFNYPTRIVNDDEPVSSSLEDMLSSSSPAPPSSLLSSGGTGDALDDIIASVTGGSSASSTSSNSKSSSSSLERHISKLPEFDQFRILHVDPMVIAVDNFFTDEECDRYVQTCTTPPPNPKSSSSSTDNNKLPPLEIKQSLTVGHDKKSKAQRTSTTWFHHYQNVPELLSKACRLLGISSGIEQFEEPQTVRYVYLT